MVKKFLKYLTFVFMGFVGGCLAPMFLSLFKATQPNNLDQAVSIANTYIVFTSIFFVGTTVLLALGGYVLSQQLATTRKQLETQAHEDLMKRIRYSETIAVEVVKYLNQNGDFTNQITENVKSIARSVLTVAQEQSVQQAKIESENAVKLKGMLSNLTNKEDS
ncbi:hypothetical protein NLHDIDDJ_02470 [Acinetobacter baumannii]|uniref:hypothetical protein n=1 Tax=Acinetobacter baumannii TaxID=470 RepID=UPI001E58D75F|nr:hypothetical protein [Acinetobacter baumannii]UDY20815.1 hypothetical protein NLHDIDDJ_02470 [Acinetobacter baumannii]